MLFYMDYTFCAETSRQTLIPRNYKMKKREILILIVKQTDIVGKTVL